MKHSKKQVVVVFCSLFFVSFTLFYIVFGCSFCCCVLMRRCPGSPCTQVRNAAVASPGAGKISSARPSLTAVPDSPCIFGPHRRPSDARRGIPGVAARNIAVASPGTGEALPDLDFGQRRPVELLSTSASPPCIIGPHRRPSDARRGFVASSSCTGGPAVPCQACRACSGPL